MTNDFEVNLKHLVEFGKERFKKYPYTEYGNELRIDDEVYALFGYVSQMRLLSNEMIEHIVAMAEHMNDNLNQFNLTLETFLSRFDGKLKDTLTNILMDWQTSGKLDDLIDASLQTEMDILEQETHTKLDEFNTQLEQSIKRGEVGVNDIDKNKGLLDETYFSESLKAQLLENTQGFTVVPADKSITRIKMADKAISPTQTDFFGLGKNLFNKYEVTKNSRVSDLTGELFEVTGVSSSKKISVVSGDVYSKSHLEAYALFSSNGSFISGGGSTSTNKQITIPPNASHIILSVKDEHLNVFQFEKGSINTSYEDFYGRLGKSISVQKESLPEIDLGMTNFGEIYPAGKNVYNPNDVDDKAVVLNGDGTPPVAHSVYRTTGYIRFKLGDSLVASRSSGDHMIIRAYEIYDSQFNFLYGTSQSSPYLPNVITSVSGSNWIRVSYVANNVRFQLEKGTLPTSYEPFIPTTKIPSEKIMLEENSKIESFWEGKKIVVNGDSVPFGTTGTVPYEGGNYDNQIPWPNVVAEGLGMDLENHAIGGSTIAVKESDPTSRNPIVSRYAEMSEGDLVMIAATTNDFQYTWTPLGDMESRTNFTYYGALHNLCLGLIEKYKGKQIVFVTPIKRGQSPQEFTNGNGKTLSDYCEIMKEVCGYYGIPVIDMYNECTINPHIDSQRSEFIPDTVHPNRAGHELMSRRITGYLRQLA